MKVFEFTKKRKISYCISALLVVVSIVAFFVQGLNVGIDFKGGTVIQVRMAAENTDETIRDILGEVGIESGAEVQLSEGDYYVRTEELTQEQMDAFTAALQEKDETAQVLSMESVGAAIGSELTRNAIFSVLIAALLMLIYISFRFELSYGIAAVVGILHNVIIVIGIFCVCQFEVNTSFIAGILTVVGYSINDTIVIFDRIRENVKLRRNEELDYTVNRSVSQTLNRSINTVLTSIFPLVMLFAMGGSSLKYFVLVMILGFLIGCYCSIFIASSFWYDLKEHGFGDKRGRNSKRRK